MRALRLWQGGAFAALVLAIAAVAGLRTVPVPLPSGADWIDGRLARAFEDHYDAVFPARTFGTNVWAALDYTLFREGKPGVVVGDEGWLYTDEDLKTYAGAEEALSAHLSLIPYVRDRLAAQGTRLLVALVPAKARVYTEHLGGHEPARVHAGLYGRARTALGAAGIAVPDLESALLRCKRMGPVFLRTDTHWTPEGARCAAQALTAGTARPATPRFVTTVDRAERRHGDLVKFLPLEPYFASLMPAMESYSVRRTEPVSGADDADALLGDAPDPDVALVGTSYSADPRWNFVGALREGLQEDVVSFASVGQGPFVPMLEYLESRAGAHAPRLLVWEIPERYLVQPRDLRVAAPAGRCPSPATAPVPASAVRHGQVLQNHRSI